MSDEKPKVCQKCFGTGFVDDEKTHMGIPMTRACSCLLAKDISDRLEKAWKGIVQAAKITESPLLDLWDQDVFITASAATLRSHLRLVGIHVMRQYRWGFKVVSDSDLITAWLANVAVSGQEIFDPDAMSASTEKATLVDLVDPPQLLVIQLGVKSARNRAMWEVFLEALQHRRHVQKPTWVVDQPDHRFDVNHIAFSDAALTFMAGWENVALDERRPSSVKEADPGTIGLVEMGFAPKEDAPDEGEPSAPTPPVVLSLSTGIMTQSTGTTRVVGRPPKDPWEDKKKADKKKNRGGDR